MPLLDVEDILTKLTIEEKIGLLSGKDFWHTSSVPRLNVPSIRVSDGPNGVRGTKFFNGAAAACFPCGTGLGATWDVELIQKAGRLMGEEAIAKGTSVILGPTVNIQRSPLGGRGFESFSEDPYLSGMIAAAIIKGIQSTGVGATIKHFVCNDQEHERQAVSAIVTERALREIYLMPFQLTMQEGPKASPWAVMTSYNKVNGIHVSESKSLIEGILRGEWGWEGLVISDWFGTYSTAESINAGLDLEMPGPAKLRGELVAKAITCRKVTERMINKRMKNLLELINKVEKAGLKENAEEKGVNSMKTTELLRDVASSSVVLLKNEGNVLPFDKNKTVAVIGSNAKFAAYSGGGSATLRPYYAVTPYDGIKAQASDIKYALGADGYKHIPLLSNLVKTSDGKSGFTAKTYAESWTRKNRKAVDEIYVEQSSLLLVDYDPPGIEGDTFYMDLEGILVPEEDGEYIFGLLVSGTAKLYIDDHCIIDNTTNQKAGNTFFGAGTVEEMATMTLQAGKPYEILIQFGSASTSTLKVPGVPALRGGGFRVGGTRRGDPQVEIKKAVQLAKEVDQVVIVTGLNSDWECEGYDRPHMSLPGLNDLLISQVAAANPQTTVVIQSGTPVSMPWASSVSSILQAWYGGNETGNAIADVLFGAQNPSGKLPLSFPHRNEDNPAFLNFRSERGRTLYGEDVYVGYRYYEKTHKEVLWPFGWGLSYSTFTMHDLHVATTPAALDGSLTITVHVDNTSAIAGAAVVQVYVSPQSPSIQRAPKELKGFAKVFLHPGASARAEIVTALKYATSFWDEDRGMWITERGAYDVLVGSSSVDTPLRGSFEVEETRWWTGL